MYRSHSRKRLPPVENVAYVKLIIMTEQQRHHRPIGLSPRKRARITATNTAPAADGRPVWKILEDNKLKKIAQERRDQERNNAITRELLAYKRDDPSKEEQKEKKSAPKEKKSKEEEVKKKTTAGFVLKSLAKCETVNPILSIKQLLPWERHAPKKLEDMLGPSESRERAQKWLSNLKERKICGVESLSCEMLLISGPAGTGKTTLARALLRSAGCTITDAPTDLPKGEMLMFIKKQTKLDVITGRLRGLLIDDVVSTIETHGVAPFQVRCACITIGTSTSTWLPREQSKLFKNEVRLWPLSDFNAERLATRVALVEHNFTLPKQVLHDIVLSSGGDMRQIIASAVYSTAATKEVSLSPFATAREIFTGKVPSVLEFEVYTTLIVQENVGHHIEDDDAVAMGRLASFAERFAFLDTSKQLEDGLIVTLSAHVALAGRWTDKRCNLKVPKRLRDCKPICEPPSFMRLGLARLRETRRS